MKTILILDDESNVRQSFFDYFEDQQWHPIMAQSGEEALQMVDEQRPDAAIVDVRLPGMNGNDFIRAALKLHDSMVFVICSGSPEYLVPEDLKILPNVSSKLVKKPVPQLSILEDQIVSLLSLTAPPENQH